MTMHDASYETEVSRTLTDEGIVERVTNGDTDLFVVLMRRNNTRLYRAARAILRDETEVEDVMQEAYVQAFSHLRDFAGRAKFSTWLTRITVNEALARARKRKRFEREDDVDEAEGLEQLERSPEQGASDSELARFLERAIDTLPENFRTVFMLRAVDEMSVAETAACLDIPEDTVKTRLFRARAILQKRLVAQLDGASPKAFPFPAPRCNRITAAVMQRIRSGSSRTPG